MDLTCESLANMALIRQFRNLGPLPLVVEVGHLRPFEDLSFFFQRPTTRELRSQVRAIEVVEDRNA
jgi:hypothetical protein